MNYRDVRGFEITVEKKGGRFIRGFANYTYHVTKSGNFGFGQFNENDYDQQNYERNYSAYYQSNPIPEPFARFNITFQSPTDFGPSFAGVNVLGDWRLNLLGEWRSGDVFTWDGGQQVQGLQDNFRWKDFYNLDLRIAKNFQTNFGRVQVFADINNVLNLKYLYNNTMYAGSFDRQKYLNSLHVPEEWFDQVDELPYDFIPGDDRPGEYRKQGVEFQPIELVPEELPTDGPSEGFERGWYYLMEDETYHRWENDSWTEVPDGEVNQMLEDKAYIDMPNDTSFRFLNPRQVFFGVRISF
jgi:hypothetical protein